MTSQAAIEMTSRALGLGIALSSFELYAARFLYTRGGLLDWNVVRLRTVLTVKLSSWPLGTLTQFRAYCFARGFIGLLIATVPDSNLLRGIALLSIAVVLVDWNIRMPYGQDGSDQMLTIGAFATGTGLISANETVVTLCCVFLAAVLVVAYVTAGLSKWYSPAWHSNALAVILRTRVYGHPTVYKYFKGRAGKIASSSIAWCEMLFVLAVIAPRSVAVIVLVLFAGFHVALAFAMGLNVFVLGFVAGYPCVLVLNDLIRAHLPW